MSAVKEQKSEPTIEELEGSAIAIAKEDASLTHQINTLIEKRNAVRVQRRSIEGKITTRRISSKV